MKNIDLTLFPHVDKEEWITLATKQLKGEDPMSFLKWQSDGIFQLEPYYDESDTSEVSAVQNYFRRHKPIEWKLYERIEVEDEKSANEKGLQALEGGCDGLIFSSQKPLDLSLLLNDILLDICDVSFEMNDLSIDLSQRDELNGYIKSGNFSTAYSEDALGKNQVGQVVDILKNLNESTHILRYASTDFFLEIATLRALRFLLNDYLKLEPNSVSIHTSIGYHSEADQQWFLNSTAGLASILGGTNSVCFSTAEGSPRISRNVGNLIREECGISSFTDQTGGAFYVEVLTDKIIRACKEQLDNE